MKEKLEEKKKKKESYLLLTFLSCIAGCADAYSYVACFNSLDFLLTTLWYVGYTMEVI